MLFMTTFFGKSFIHISIEGKIIIHIIRKRSYHTILIYFMRKTIVRSNFLRKMFYSHCFLLQKNYPKQFPYESKLSATFSIFKKKHFLSLSALFSVKKIFIRINFATFSLWESIIAIFCAANTPRIKNPHHIL